MKKDANNGETSEKSCPILNGGKPKFIITPHHHIEQLKVGIIECDVLSGENLINFTLQDPTISYDFPVAI